MVAVRPMRIHLRHLLIAMIPIAMFTALAAAVGRARTEAKQSQCHGEMFQLGHALRGYRYRTGHFPPAVSFAPDGSPMHSWRAFAFAEIGSDFGRLYNFALPWDSPGNLKAAAGLDRNLACPNTQGDSPRYTNYVAVLFRDGTSTLSRADSGIGIDTDHPDRILFLEYPDSTIPWTAPRDLGVDELASLGPGDDPRGLGVILADGSFRRLSREEILRRLGPAYR